jgi:serine/threonine protein kinase
MATEDPTDNNARTRVVDSGAPLALAAGTLLGRYRIDGVLGQGGFGITYRATDTALNRAIAIKEYLPSDVAIRIDGSTVIPRSRTDADDYDWGLKRFLDEAKTLAQHEAVPNVVRVYDFVEANGTAYMVMALVEGENLSAILRQRGTLNEQELRAIVLPLLDGLEQLHETGLIHRDIKPANIILRAGRGPTLIDFGAAREGLGRKSRSVTSILTPGYAPFEQYGSAGDQGPWTDIYALAATLYHSVTGKAPPDSVDRIRRDPMVPAVQAGAGRYSETFLAAIDAGLKVDERERPQNAAQWRAMFIDGTPLAAPMLHPVSLKPTAVPTPASPPPAPSAAVAAPASARTGSLKLLIAAGAAAILVAGGAAIAVTMSSSAPPAATPPGPGASDPTKTEIALAEQRRSAESQARAAEQAENARKLQAQAADAERIRRAEQERRIAEEAENRRRLEAQIAEARRQTEEELRRKAVEEARLKAELDAREKAEAEARTRLEEETRRKVEAEFKARAELEARQRQVEEEARRKTEEAHLKTEDAKRKVEEARKKVEEARQKTEQRTGGAPAAQPAPQSAPQVAAAAPPADPAAYVAKYWPVMRAQVEAAINGRGIVTDPVSGVSMRLGQIYGYKLVSAGADTIVLAINYRNVRAIPGGVMTGNSSDITETAAFRNQPPGFPLVSIK